MTSFLKALPKTINRYQSSDSWTWVPVEKPQRMVPFPETPYGSRVIFTHTNVCNDVIGKHNFEMAFSNAKPALGGSSGLRQAVVCVLRIGDISFFGVSACSPLDTFNSKIGRAIALRRALHAMNTAGKRYNYYGTVKSEYAEFVTEYGDPVLYRIIMNLLNHVD